MPRLWLAMRTRNRSRAGTDSKIELIINQGGSEIVNAILPILLKPDQEIGQANLYALEVPALDPGQLGFGSLQIGIRGSDMWLPEHVLAFYEPEAGTVVPLAIESDMQTRLSTDPDEGQSSVPLSRALPGTAAMTIERLFLAFVSVWSTKAVVQLQLASQTALLLQYSIPDTPQEDLKFGRANLYVFPLPVPVTRTTLSSGSMSLTTRGRDVWQPEHFFLFGLARMPNGQTRVTPLVYVPGWTLGALTTDSELGRETIRLPMAALP